MSAKPLAQHRLERAWSQAELAEACAVSRAELSGIETGRLVPSVAVALRIASALGTSVEELFGRRPKVATISWAWRPRGEDPRLWRATLNGRVLAYPVETTHAGVIAHDALATARGIDVIAPETRPDRTLIVAGCDP